MRTTGASTYDALTDIIGQRIAGAPASWGICEVPGWGHQLDANRVLGDMQSIGITRTELGPDGFIPGTPVEQCGLLASYGLQAIGAFCPIVLYRRDVDVQLNAQRILDRFDVLGSRILVIAADSGETDYDGDRRLSTEEWEILLSNIEVIDHMAAERGVRACVHPHMGTVIETRADVDHLLGASDIPICLDTGHLLIGGSDPVQLARDVPDRIAHVHFKDVDPSVLETVRSGQRTYTEGVRAGMYRVLGEGAIDLAAIVGSLETSGYGGRYVPEQDRILATANDAVETSDQAGASVDYLARLILTAGRS